MSNEHNTKGGSNQHVFSFLFVCNLGWVGAKLKQGVHFNKVGTHARSHESERGELGKGEPGRYRARFEARWRGRAFTWESGRAVAVCRSSGGGGGRAREREVRDEERAEARRGRQAGTRTMAMALAEQRKQQQQR